MKALLCSINFDYTTNLVKTVVSFEYKKRKEKYTKLNHASKFTLTSISLK